jgi:hypothetical protein
MQVTQPPQPATAPIQPPASARSITTVGADGKPQTLTVPATSSELRELLTQRSELSEQLSNVSARRASLAQQVRNSGDGVTRSGLEARLNLLDQRILQLETDLATTGRQIAMAPAELLEGAYNQGKNDEGFEEGMMAGGFSVLFASLVLFFFARRRWKRRARGISAPDGDSTQRLERLENGMDAIALEIERISEGQRFVTKLLSESQSPLGAQNRIAQPAGAERPRKS